MDGFGDEAALCTGSSGEEGGMSFSGVVSRNGGFCMFLPGLVVGVGESNLLKLLCGVIPRIGELQSSFWEGSSLSMVCASCCF